MESFQQAQDWLETLEPKWGVLSGKQKLSLEVVRELLSLLGDPDKFFKYRVIVGGTAGKGTVARKLCATLHEAGVKVGCLTSPHLQTPLERIKIGDHLVDPALFGRCLLEIKAVSQDLVPTQYEAILLAGVLCCQKEACEVLIAEVGLGGEFDGVNALRGPRIAAVTFIGDDHRDILGDFPQMARTKAKIFNEDSRLNLSYEKVYKDIFNQTAVGSVEYIKGVPTNLSSKLVKRIAREILGAERSFEVVHVKLPARWEKIPEDKYQNAYLTAGPSTLILDGSHSRPRFDWIVSKVKKLSSPKYAIFSMAKNHDPESFRGLYDLFDAVIFTQSKSQETQFYTPQELQEIFPGSLVAPDFDTALSILNTQYLIPHTSELSKGTILVTGSFYFCGEVRERFYPKAEIIKHRSEFF